MIVNSNAFVYSTCLLVVVSRYGYLLFISLLDLTVDCYDHKYWSPFSRTLFTHTSQRADFFFTRS